MFQLQGVKRSIDVSEMTLVIVIVASKIYGWRGGNGFLQIHGSQVILRRITNGIVVSAEEAKEWGIILYDIVQNKTDSDAGLRKNTFAADLLKMCLEGGFRIVELPE